MRKKWIISVLAALSFLLAGSVLTLSLLLNRERIKVWIISQAERKLEGQLDFSSVHFTLFKKFPQASVQLTDVIIYLPEIYDLEKVPLWSSDTLLFAEKVYLQMNIRELLRKNYLVNEIILDNSLILLERNAGSLWNHKGLLKTSAQQGHESAGFEVKKLNLKGGHLQIVDVPNDMHIVSRPLDLQLRIKSAGKGTNLQASLNAEIVRAGVGPIQLPVPFMAETEVRIEINESQIVLHPGVCELAGLPLLIQGTMNTGQRSWKLDLEGERLNIKSILSLLPENLLKNIKLQLSSGEANVRGTVYQDSVESRPAIEAEFSIHDAEIRARKKMASIRELNASGSYTNRSGQNQESPLLEIRLVHALPGSGNMHGEMKLYGKEMRIITGNIHAELVLEEIYELFQIPEIEFISGSTKADISFDGRMDSGGKFSLKSLNGLKTLGNIRLSGTRIKLQSIPFDIDAITGDLVFAEHIWFDDLEFTLPGNRFVADGQFRNAIPFLLGKEKILDITGSLWNADFQPELLFSGRSQRDTSMAGDLPFFRDLRMDLKIEFPRFAYKDFVANNMRGHLSYSPYLYVLHDLVMDGMEGHMHVQASTWRENEHFRIGNIQTIFKDVNIRELFTSFHNFGQVYIRDSNLQGSLTGDLNMRIPWQDNKALLSDMVVFGHFNITQGELIDFEPALSLSKFVALSELQHIRFSTLENEIYIENGMVHIPKMDIQSSAFNITLAGNHSFDNQVDYSIKVLLSEVLFNKARISKPQNEEFGQIEEDGLGNTSLYLSYTGVPGDYRIAYDQKAARLALKQRWTQEGQLLRDILREEFQGKNQSITQDGYLNNVSEKPGFHVTIIDSAGRSKDTGSLKKPRFRISWEEDNPPDTTGKK